MALRNFSPCKKLSLESASSSESCHMVVGAVFNLKAPLKVLKSESLEVSLAPLLNTKDENTALLSACNIQERKQQRNQFRDLGNNTNKLVQEDSFSSKIKIVRKRAEETDSRRFSEHRKAEKLYLHKAPSLDGDRNQRVIFGENRSATPESRISANFRTIRHCHVSSSSPSKNNSYKNKTVCRSSDSQTQEADEDETLSRVPRISRPNEFSPGFQAHESTDGCSTTGTGRKLRILERNFRLLEKELQSDHMFSMLAVSCLSFRKSLRKQVSKRGSNPAFKTHSRSLQVRSTSPKAYLFFQRSQTGSQSSEQQAKRDYIFAGVLWLRRACKKNTG